LASTALINARFAWRQWRLFNEAARSEALKALVAGAAGGPPRLPTQQQLASLQGAAQAALDCALRATRRAAFVSEAADAAAAQAFFIAESTHAAADARARGVFCAWARWAKLSAEGRFALVVGETAAVDDGRGFKFARDLNTALRHDTLSGLKPRFVAPYDTKRMALIARNCRLRKYCGAWKMIAKRWAAAKAWRRKKVSTFLVILMRKWCRLASFLQASRREAARRRKAHSDYMLSQPLKAWYVWVRLRLEARIDADRIVAAYRRIKKRHLLAALLRAWRHSAELQRLEARYTRRQLMGALTEQKQHIGRLERLVEEHDSARTELEAAADAQKQRAMKIAKLATFRDDDVRACEAKIKSAESDVELAQMLLRATMDDRASISDHILKAQPGFGFVDRGLADLAESRAKRAADGTAAAQPSPLDAFVAMGDSENVGNGGGFSLAATIARDEPAVTAKAVDLHVPEGLKLLSHPSYVGGLMLCTAADAVDDEAPAGTPSGDASAPDDASASTPRAAAPSSAPADASTPLRPEAPADPTAPADLNKWAFVVRLDWAIQAHGGGVLRFRELADDNGLPLCYGDISASPGASVRSLQDGVSVDDTVLLQDVNDVEVNDSIVKLVLAFTEMHAVYDFLRMGDSSILPTRLQADWADYTAAASKASKRSWPTLTATSPATERQMHWADVRNALGARMPPKAGQTDLAKYFDASRQRYENTFLALFKDTRPSNERPNVYSHQPVQDDFAPKEKDYWDA